MRKTAGMGKGEEGLTLESPENLGQDKITHIVIILPLLLQNNSVYICLCVHVPKIREVRAFKQCTVSRGTYDSR